MKTLSTFFILFLVAILLSGCPGNNHKYKYSDAYFPDSAVNITEVNSEFDDYNSILPETHFGKRLLFSSNRMYDPENYDIYDGNFYVVWDWETGDLTFKNDYHYGYEDFVRNMVQKIDNDGNQFAPYSVATDTFIDGHQNHISYLFYSTNAGGDSYRSEFMYYITPNDGASGEVTGPDTISFLGAVKQQYISFYGPDVVQINTWDVAVNEFTEMYFDDFEGEKADIYKIDIPDTLDFMSFITSDNDYEKVKVEKLNSEYNDRCPFVNGNVMVFTSDRPGGYGGYDLYYAIYENGEWSEPVNFGDKVNSEYDEFRPIITNVDRFKNDLMIFSSNRPGGLGGFDLYFVGIDKIFDITLLIE